MKHIMEADGIQLNFGLKKILSDVYLICETGSVTGLLGRNGSGKSCLMNVIYGTLRCPDKSIRFDHNKISIPFSRPRLIKFLPQHHFIPKALYVNRVFLDFGLDWKKFEERFHDSNIRGTDRMMDLSGGQRRLIELFTILTTSCQFVLLDEPFTHIMPMDVEKIKQLITEEKQRKGILLTDQMYKHIVELSGKLYLLKDGKTWLTRSPSDLEVQGYTLTEKT